MRQITVVDAEGNLSPAVMLPPIGETMALDFEGTGPNVYAKDFAPRLCQVTFDGDYAYVFDANEYAELIRYLVRRVQTLIVHNGSYDLIVLDECYDIPLEETWEKTADTQDMARLRFPTESEKLKDLMRSELGFETDSDKELRAEFMRLKLRPISTGYCTIPLDNEVFQRYAGLDAIGTYRLALRLAVGIDPHLLKVERAQHFQAACMVRRGLLVDVDEVNRLIDLLSAGIDEATKRVNKLGLDSNIATDDGKAKLETFLKAHDAKLSYTPKSEKLSTGADDLALAVLEADKRAKVAVEDLLFIRKAEHFRIAYLEAFLEYADENGRLHPSIRTMAARTHRWSISDPPLQQIPSHPLMVKLRRYIDKHKDS